MGPCTIHDLRRSCITNWAQRLPIHVVQQLAGHSDIQTTQQFYLSVQPDDVTKAQRIQEKVLRTVLPEGGTTDQRLTNSARKRASPGRRAFEAESQVPEKQGLGRLRATGLEPVTFGSVDRCSIQLSYAREIQLFRRIPCFYWVFKVILLVAPLFLPCVIVRWRA